MSLFGRRDDPPDDPASSDTTTDVSPGTRRRLATRAIERRLALSVPIDEDEEDDDSKQDEQAKEDEQRRRQMEEDEAFARRLQEEEERAAARRAQPAMTRSQIDGILSSDESSVQVMDDEPMPRRAPIRLSLSPSPPRNRTGAPLATRRPAWLQARARTAFSPVDSDIDPSRSLVSSSPPASRTPSPSPARTRLGSPHPRSRTRWLAPAPRSSPRSAGTAATRDDVYVRSIPSLLPRATAPHPTPQVGRRTVVTSSRPAPPAAAPAVSSAPRHLPRCFTSSRTHAAVAAPTSAATTSALSGVASRNLAPTHAAPTSTTTGYLSSLAGRHATTMGLLRQLGHGLAVPAPPTAPPPSAPAPAPTAPQNNVALPTAAPPAAMSADDAAVAAGAPYAIVSGVRKVHRWEDKRTFRFAPGERLERVRGMRPVIYRRQTTGYKALPPPAPGVTYPERVVMHLISPTLPVSVPSAAAASAQPAQTSAGLVAALGLPPATATQWGDCCICFDEANNPVGCQSCKQLVGCEDCVCMWYGMAGAAGSASVGAHRSCPLCRFEWLGVPQVARMEDLQG